MYEDSFKREHKNLLIQTEYIYQALVVSLSMVINRVSGGEEEIPKSLGLLEIFNQKSYDKLNKIDYFTENARDILDIL